MACMYTNVESWELPWKAVSVATKVKEIGMPVITGLRE